MPDPCGLQLRFRLLAGAAIVAAHAGLLGWFLLQPGSSVPTVERLVQVSFVVAAPAAMVAPAPPPPPPVQPVAKPAPTVVATRAPPVDTALRVPPEPPRQAPAPQPEVPPPQLPVTTSAAVATPAAANVAVTTVPPDFRAAYLNNPGPRYPNASRRRREEGTVVLKVLVSADGEPEQVLLEQSSGHDALDEAALGVVRDHWKFEPAREHDVPVPAWVAVPMQFSLKNR